MNILKCVVALFSILPINLLAQADSTPDMLVRNVTLIDPQNVTPDKLVNILIKNGKLDVVTEDKISSDESGLVVDANKGLLLGHLNIGETPSFIIFNTDPRKNFEVLMDTKTYSVFAVDDGVVVKNNLAEVVDKDPIEEPTKNGWLAYTPPPFMVPLNYQDAGRWNQWDNKYTNGVFTSFLALDRMYWLDQDAGSQAQFPGLNLYDGGEIRGLRFGVVGRLKFQKPWVYTIFAATHAFDRGFEIKDEDSLSFSDYRLDIPFFEHSVMSIGKQKQPISMEMLTGSLFLSNQERAGSTTAMLPARNVGIVWNGSKPDHYSSWAFGAFRNWIDAPTSFDDTATQLAGRVTWAPFVSKDESNLLHLAAGYLYSDAKNGFRFATTPEFVESPNFLDTGAQLADSTDTYDLELAWLRGPFLMTAEYLKTDVNNEAIDNPSFDGYYINLAWILTGEMRKYNKKGGVFSGIPVAQSVYQGGKGSWETYMRYSETDLQGGSIDGGRMRIFTVGLNWWLSSAFNVSLGYKYIESEIAGVRGNTSGALARVMLILQ